MAATVFVQSRCGVLHDLHDQAGEGAVTDRHSAPRHLQQANPKRPYVCRLRVPVGKHCNAHKILIIASCPCAPYMGTGHRKRTLIKDICSYLQRISSWRQHASKHPSVLWLCNITNSEVSANVLIRRTHCATASTLITGQLYWRLFVRDLLVAHPSLGSMTSGAM